MMALLDSHAVLWAGHSREKLGPEATQIIADDRNLLYVSAASAWEIATKVRLGKWPEAVVLEENFLRAIAEANFTILSISAQHALDAGRLTGIHKDPFDRMIAAQALALDIAVISIDAKLDAFDVRRIW